MNRIISLSVEDMYIKYTGEAFGATGSHNAVTLRMTFGPAWEGTAKTAYFTDSLGNTSVALVLGLDTLVDGAYEVDVPSEALKTAGVATITIKGVLVSGETTTKAITTAPGHFRVLDSELPDSAGSAGTITPSDKDQLQAEIAGMEALFTTAKAAAEAAAANAKASETAAAASAANGETANKSAQSWAVGGTGTRPGEDTNNAKYWAEHAEAVAGGDFATKVEAQGYVTAHNESENAHHDLRVAVAGSIRYDAVQSLTDEQKAQARGNINSAPGGFGWGDSLRNVLASDAEDTYETYCGKLDALLADMPDGTSQLIYTRGPASTGQYSGAGNIVAVLSKLLGTSASLIGISPEPRGTTNGLWRMLKDNGVWRPVEWSNPPMELGVEYRTTERYLGKPVYVKTVDCGTPQTNTTWATPHGISGVKNFISATAQSGVYIANGIFKGSEGLGGDSVTIATDPTNIHISTYGYWTTSEHAIALLKYTKTTD